MKGLLLKDFYMTCSYYPVYILFVLVFSVVLSFVPENMYFLMFLCAFGSVIPMSLLAYDEQSGWDKFSETLPYTKAQPVTEKYLFGLLESGLLTAVIGVTVLAGMIIRDAFVISYFITWLALAFVLSLSMSTFCMSFMFWLGVQKGRIVFYALIIFFSVLLSVRFKYIIDTPVMTGKNASIIIPVIICGAIMYALSWLLSIRLFSKRREQKSC